MKPIQNRISSLKVQTQQYEKMERIPGGPQHFISTAISELEEIRDVQLSQLDSEVGFKIIYFRNKLFGIKTTHFFIGCKNSWRRAKKYRHLFKNRYPNSRLIHPA